MLDVNMFDQLKIGLATADQIRMWSHGEVKKPETINYRTLRPEKDGLFCEKIFGPTRDWECYCGKYKRVRFKGIICERCGVEVTRSKVRRDRMGHIELSAPVVHIWYLRGTRSWLAYLLAGIEPKEELKAKQLEKVIYFAANLVTWVDEDKRHEDLANVEAEYLEERDAIQKELELAVDRRYKELESEAEAAESEGTDTKKLKRDAEREIEALRERYDMELDLVARTWDEFKSLHSRKIIDDEVLWRELRDKYGDYFEGGTGADAIKQLIDRIDFDEEEIKLREAIEPGTSGRKPLSAQRRQKAIKRLKIVASFNRRDDHGRRINDPKAMILDTVPVIPPELRPMVQLDGGRFATSDLNDLYRRVINRNNRLKRLLDLGAPEIIVNNEKRMLQEAVDALFDNGRRGRPVTGPGNRPLKSLSDMLKGKQGRFRQNLLGKRVDYSGRSVIVAGPTLKLHQCGLPKLMALELFKPFVMKRLVDLELAQNIKTAKRMVERRRPQVWDVLEDVIKEHPVLLNRAPTLHRLGIQAFEPVLVEGKALQIHPLVCTAFNADFDGDQMAIHVPLSAEAQAEARVLMLSANNILSPASGRPIVTPTQDLVIGGYYLTESVEGGKGEGRVFRHLWEAIRAYDEGGLELHAKITMRTPGKEPVETTVGRAMFEETLPADYTERFGHVTATVKKREMGVIVERLSENYPTAMVASSLDAIKNLCYRYASQSGLTVSIDDVKTPKAKRALLDGYEAQADKVETQFRRGIITDGERRQQEVRIWTDATAEVQAAMEAEFKSAALQPDRHDGRLRRPREHDPDAPDRRHARPGGQPPWRHDPASHQVELPRRSRDARVLHRHARRPQGPRRHRAAYRRLRLPDPPSRRRRPGADRPRGRLRHDARRLGRERRTRHGEPPQLPRDQAVRPGACSTTPPCRTARSSSATRRSATRRWSPCATIRRSTGCGCVRCSRATPSSASAPCATAVHWPPARRSSSARPSASSPPSRSASPARSSTMRTFHTGGVAGKDIAGGLPRVVELFEARTPRGAARLAKASGVLRLGEDEGKGIPVMVVDNEGDEHEVVLPLGARPIVHDGQEVKAGDPITDGPFDPKELMEIKGIRETQLYLVEEVQRVYRDQGVSIHDKHIELIVRQMTRRIGVQEPGDTDFLPGERVDSKRFRDINRGMVEATKRPAEGRPEIMGITKASLATESWLSAASFQETTRVLTEAAIDGRGDSLIGLKENIIIGKLIPAGTGMMKYREFGIEAPDYEPMTYYSSDTEEEDPAAFLASLHGSYDGAPAETAEV